MQLAIYFLFFIRYQRTSHEEMEIEIGIRANITLWTERRASGPAVGRGITLKPNKRIMAEPCKPLDSATFNRTVACRATAKGVYETVKERKSSVATSGGTTDVITEMPTP
jgi:hypothetical protein